jgi:kynurenine formamidase
MTRTFARIATAGAALLLAGAVQAQTQPQAQAPSEAPGQPGCYKSKWGPDDQIGALNNITSENTLAATKLIKRGKSIQMGIETNSRTPAFPPRTFSMTILTPGQEGGRSLAGNKLTYNDDIVSGWLGIGTQIDGLGHIGIDGMYYNCTKIADFVKPNGLTKFGVETIPAIATRGVILDMVGLLGKDPVPEGTAFNRKEIEEAVKRQKIAPIGKGDVVIFYTGWTKLIGKDDKRYGSVEPGLGVDGARYLASLQVALVGSDTWGVEVLPFENPANAFEVHQILIVQHGTMLLENVVAEEAVKDGVYEGLFTLGASRLTGAVQAIINPVFIY